MKSKLEGIPRFSTTTTTVAAKLYNIVRLGVLRLGSPLEFSIPELKNLELILDKETWICFDSSLNDIPVLAWTDFETGYRENLNEPIACQLLFYHIHANKIIDIVTQKIYANLDSRLHDHLHRNRDA